MKSPTPDQPASATPERRLRLGVWGLGRGTHIIKTAVSAQVDIVAGCDFNPHFIEQFRQAVPEGRFTDSAEEFLSWDFDAVLLATYCPAHATDAMRCLRAGKHVLSEVTAFHTPSEGVALVEEVERSGLVYQLAENYPYTLENRYLAQRWREGLFGELQYAEYSYIHDCLNLAYTYIDGTPVVPGSQVHGWRSWLPWHYYCTHSLGPVMAITGTRPESVVALPGDRRLPGHLMTPPLGLAGMAPSLIRMNNGGLVRNLMGGSTHDRDFKILYGTKGASELIDGQLRLRLGGRGHSPCHRVIPREDELSKQAAASGHGGADFWVLYHFAQEILFGKKGGFDVYQACDLTLPGIQAYRSSVQGGAPQEIPNFRKPAERERYRHDHFAPERYDTVGGVFPKNGAHVQADRFTKVMKDLLEQTDLAQSFFAWEKVLPDVSAPAEVLQLGREVLERHAEIVKTVLAARELIDAFPGSDGARVLQEVLERIPAELFSDSHGAETLRQRCDDWSSRLVEIAAPGTLPQLRMMREGFDALPEVTLPEGYTLRSFQPGDESAWCRIIGAAFEGEWTLEQFKEAMLQRPDYLPERILFVCDAEGQAVATAAAYGSAHEGYVHYVGIVPEHGGLGLGYQASLATLHQFRARGCATAVLDTDDFRSSAIRVYWRLGFRPVFSHASHRDRWRGLMEKLQLQDES